MPIKGSFAQITIAGALSRDPELRYTPSGKAVAKLNIPVNRYWTGSTGEKQTEVTWYRVEVWGAAAENVGRFCRKGSVVLVIGRLKPDEHGNPATWTKKDGTTGASFEVTAQTVQFMHTGDEAPSGNGMDDHDFGTPLPMDDDEIPF